MHAQAVSNEQQMAELHLLAGFHPLHRAAVEAGRVSEHLLGHVLVQPPHADAVTDSPAGVKDPLRVVGGWHPTHALATMIISQQQI